MKRIINEYYINEKILIIFFSLFVTGIILFVLVWSVSYYFFPEVFLKGKAISESVMGIDASNSLLVEWGKFAGYSFVAVGLVF